MSIEKHYERMRSAKNEKSYWQTETISLEARPSSGNSFVLSIDPSRKRQSFKGFGGACTEAAASVISALSAKQQTALLEAYFDPQKGLAYEFARSHINSCDFSLGNYACADLPQDTDLKSFTLAREERFILPLLRQAQTLVKKASSQKELKLLLSPWSPPAWMKSNGEMNHGGTLLPEYRETWARYYGRFVKELEALGFTVWGLTVQNEPAASQTWDSCRYTAKEEALFVAEFLGPQLQKDGLGHLELFGLDHNRDIFLEWADAYFAQGEARDYCSGLALHWYAPGNFEALDRFHESFPDKKIIFTEGCIEAGAKPGVWDRGEVYAHNIMGDLNHWTELWIDWNLALDMKGGPNHAGNLCDAPVLVDADTDSFILQSSYYYLGHFSRYLVPGSRILESRLSVPGSYVEAEGRCASVAYGGPKSGLEVLAFEQPGGRKGFVVCNRGDNSETLELQEAGQDSASVYSISLAPHSIESFLES